MIDRIIDNVCFYLAPIDIEEMRQLDIQASVRVDLAVMLSFIAAAVLFNVFVFESAV